MFGSMEIGEYVIIDIIGERDIGKDQVQGFGSVGAGNQGTVAGIGDVDTGNK
jgi:hypothetical protein